MKRSNVVDVASQRVRDSSTGSIRSASRSPKGVRGQSGTLRMKTAQVDIIIYLPPPTTGRHEGVCVEAFSEEGKRFLQSVIYDNHLTVREHIEQSGLRYEVVTRQH